MASTLISYSHPIHASSSTTSSPATLDQKFGRKGINFTHNSVELSVRNGSSLKLRLPDGVVTSYRPKVYWREDGFEEIVHVEKEKGGIGLVLNRVSDVAWSAEEWEVRDSDSDSIDAVQVELTCTNGDGSLDITYIISLYEVSMATAVIVKNKGSKPVTLTSAMMSHLKIKGRSGSAIQGLKGCSYCSHPPLASKFQIMSPTDAMKPEDSGWFGSDNNQLKPGLWQPEEEQYTIMKNKLSRVYAAPPSDRLKRIYNTPPSMYQTVDQGNGLGFRVIRMGYDDIYIGSPGSLSKKYGNDYFICTGPASMLVPVVVKPGEKWRGAQVIEHDNL